MSDTPTLVQQLHGRVPIAALILTPAAEPFGPVRAALEEIGRVNPHYTKQALKRIIDSGAYNDNNDGDDDGGGMDWAYDAYVQMLGVEADYDLEDCVRYTFGSGPGATAVSLLEKPRVLAARSTTGFRTWEAALVLSDWMLQHREAVAGRVLELGCGTGLCSLVLLQAGLAQWGCVTDGDDGLVHGQLVRNFELNGAVPGGADSVALGGADSVALGGADSVALAAEPGSQAESRADTDSDTEPGIQAQTFALPSGSHAVLRRLLWDVDGVPPGVETVIGADITFDPTLLNSLCATLRSALVAGAQACYISATVRNAETHAGFHRALAEAGLKYTQVHEALSFETPLLRMQRPALLAPVVIYKIVLE